MAQTREGLSEAGSRCEKNTYA